MVCPDGSRSFFWKDLHLSLAQPSFVASQIASRQWFLEGFGFGPWSFVWTLKKNHTRVELFFIDLNKNKYGMLAKKLRPKKL